MESADSSVTCGSSSVHKRGIARLVAALAFLAALTALPGCDSLPKPPTPVLAGPDTGWTHAPTAFAATPTDFQVEAGAVVDFDWGDSSANGGYSVASVYEHPYEKPGTYVVKCRFRYFRLVMDEWTDTRAGDWSNPCTVHIVPDTLTHPDSVYAKVELGHHASWSCVLPNGSTVYLTSGDDNSVYVLDPGTNSVTDSIRVQSDPTCCVASNAGDKVYVSNHGSNSISVIRTSDNSAVDTIPLPAAPNGLVLLPGDTLLNISHATKNEVSVVRLSDDSIVASIPVSDSPCAMTCTPDGQHVYVPDMGSDRVTIISTLRRSVERSFGVGGRPSSILFSPSGETAYVGCLDVNKVPLFRCSDLTAIDSIGLLLGPLGNAWHLLMLPGYRCLYVISSYDASYIVRRSDNCLLRELWLTGPGGPSVLPDGSRLYVPNGNVVTVLGPGSK